jgi:SNF2 family DNA or RNA helicase
VTEPFIPEDAQHWKPLPYMKRARKFLLDHDAAALLLRPGGRKTSITLSAICELIKRGQAKKVLVLAPLRPCYRVWPAEVKKWREFEHLRVEVLHGPKKDQALTRDADVYVMNFEGLDWLLKATKTPTFGGKTSVRVDPKRFAKLGFDTLVVDELTKCKSTSSQRFKALKHVLGTFKRRWGLTGSPNANGLLQLFGQCYVLDMGKALGPFVTRYRIEYFTAVDPNGWKWVPRPGAAERIYKALAPLAFRMEESEYPQLPPVVHNTICVDLPPAARKVYDLLEEDLLARVGDRLVVAANAAAASSKCRQLASGAVYLDPETDELGLAKLRKGGKEWAEVHQAKLDALVDLVDELQGEPLLVGYDFRHDAERVCARLRKDGYGDVPVVGGGTSAKASGLIEARWNCNEVPVLLGHPQSMGHGLNLQGGSCANVCWFTGTWDFELDDQFFRRVWRDGTGANQVFLHRIVARDTVDEVQVWSLRSKDRGQRALFDALGELARRRGKKWK